MESRLGEFIVAFLKVYRRVTFLVCLKATSRIWNMWVHVMLVGKFGLVFYCSFFILTTHPEVKINRNSGDVKLITSDKVVYNDYTQC